MPPDRDALIRPVGAVLAEGHDDCSEGRRYLGLDALAGLRPVTDHVTGLARHRACTSPGLHVTGLARHRT
jgi:hypothetical protein